MDVTFFDDGAKPCRAWKLTNSQVYELVDFHSRLELPTKGHECDWAPLIGKI